MIWLWLIVITVAASSAQLLPARFGNGRFYYESLESDKISFYTNRWFRAAYTSQASSVQWLTDPTCSTAADPTSKFSNQTIRIRCTSYGSKWFQVYRDGNTSTADTFYVTIKKSPGCYQWYIVSGVSRDTTTSTWIKDLNSVKKSDLGSVPSYTSGIQARVWVVDPSRMSSDEASGRAVQPSDYSLQVTASFYSLGELPVLTLLWGDRLKTSSTNFSTEGYWSLVLQSGSPGSAPLQVEGQDISVFDCSAESIQSVIDVSKYNSGTKVVLTQLSTNVSVSSSDAYLRLALDICSPTVAYVTSSSFGPRLFLFSQNELSSSSLYSLPAELSISSIIDIVATYATTFFNTDVGMFWTKDLVTFTKPEGLPNIPFAFLRGPSYCDISLSAASMFNNIVLAWNRGSNVGRLYFSTNGGVRFTSIEMSLAPLSTTQATVTGFIRDATVLHTQGVVLVLISDQSGIDRMVSFDPKTLKFENLFAFRDVSSYFPMLDRSQAVNQPVRQLAVDQASGGDLYVWGSSVVTSPNGGESVFQVDLKSRDPFTEPINLASNEFVVDMARSFEGSFAFLTSANRVFAGKSGINVAVEIAAGIPIDAIATLGFDALSRLVVYSTNSNVSGPYIISRIISLTNEIESPRVPVSLNPSLACVNYGWSTDIQDEYFLDMDETESFTAVVQPFESESSSISVSFSNVSSILINRTISDSVIRQGSLNIRQRTVNVSFVSRGRGYSGKTEVKIRPQAVDLGCDKVEQVSVVRLGCPTARRLVLRASSTYPPLATSCASLSNTTFNVPAGEYITDYATMSSSNHSSVIPYSCNLFGIPVQTYYGSFFVPMFDLYDGNTFVRNVTTDISLWELMNQTTFIYNTTAGAAGCLIKPQRWEDFFSTGSPGTSWGSWNYQSCWDPSLTKNISNNDASSITYQILNATNYNALTWKAGHDGLYIFQATVMDPDFSFCTLQTQFAVYVYGAPIPPALQVTIIVALVVSVLFALAASYFTYKQARTKEKKA
ncbi:cation channel sperm-associated protein subunit delta-domain-containing protein [Cladochytrium replicatum]|nr:cation channel sperm-associated protein subunit delta-domain-containing protein [Cladochytrium replicatum]